MAHAAWIGDLTAAQRDTAFGTGEGRLGFSVLRIPVGENQADWSRDLATAKRAVELGATVFASPWNPPASMIETFTRGSQTNAKRLRYSSYAAYAQHLNDFTTLHAQQRGATCTASRCRTSPTTRTTGRGGPRRDAPVPAGERRLDQHQGHRARVLPVREVHVGPDPQRLHGARQRGHHRRPPLRHVVLELPLPPLQAEGRGQGTLDDRGLLPQQHRQLGRRLARGARRRRAHPPRHGGRRVPGVRLVVPSGAATAPCARTARSASAAP